MVNMVGPAGEIGAAEKLAGTSLAEQIANGHAFEKHVINGGEFPGISTREEFANHIDNVISNASDIRSLEGGRTAYWHNESGTIVINDPNRIDGGTAFKPRIGKDYFDYKIK